ncbi:hypothetical protein AB0I53_19960 [Saccharopolyspora sp. NPDC050389]|uniref:hypothetical protein n=1 Tax=Saccharopolyspora sp. NPDC050389 TaxID=3155516 RepID=UPI00340DDAD4
MSQWLLILFTVLLRAVLYGSGLLLRWRISTRATSPAERDAHPSPNAARGGNVGSAPTAQVADPTPGTRKRVQE